MCPRGARVINASFGHPTPQPKRSVQPFLHSSWQSVIGHVRACPLPKNFPSYGGSGPHLMHASLGPPESIPKWHLDRFSCFCTADGSVSSGLSGHALPEIAPSHGGTLTPSNMWLLGSIELASQTAPRSVRPFLHSSPQNVPVLYSGLPLPPKLLLPMGGLGPI